jgi:hypothetical protein
MSENSSRGLPRPIDAAMHGATDYTVGTLLMTAFPRLAGISGTDSARQVRIAGAVHAGYSTITDYPLGAVKVLPYKVHLALDGLGAIALAATPFVTGQWKKGRKHFVPHLGLAAFEIVSLLLTDPTGRGSDSGGDTDAVRAGNRMDPSDNIRNGGLAVTPASA